MEKNNFFEKQLRVQRTKCVYKNGHTLAVANLMTAVIGGEMSIEEFDDHLYNIKEFTEEFRAEYMESKLQEYNERQEELEEMMQAETNPLKPKQKEKGLVEDIISGALKGGLTHLAKK